MTKRVFINEDLKATFICPTCGKYKTADVSKYKDIQKAVKIKVGCVCGTNYTVMLERRVDHRAPTKLRGEYYPLGFPLQREPVEILNISHKGLKFKIFFQPKVKIGDEVAVEFRLDDLEDSFVRREGVVRNMDPFTLGIEFTDKDPYGPMNKYLYLKFKT